MKIVNAPSEAAPRFGATRIQELIAPSMSPLLHIVSEWEGHCAEIGHVTAEQGGTARFDRNSSATRIECRAKGCRWSYVHPNADAIIAEMYG